MELEPRDLSSDPAVHALARMLNYRGPVKTINSTWLGARATATTHWMNTNRNGERITIQEWHDPSGPSNGDYPAGTVTIHCYTGDFVHGTGKSLIARAVLTDAHRTWLAAQRCDAAWREYQENLPDKANDVEVDGTWQAERDLAALVVNGYIEVLPADTRALLDQATLEMRDQVDELGE